MGQFAAKQIRHIATYFPGRMAGSPAELLAADYLKQQFTEMGYPADTRTFDARYLYTNKDTSENWRKISVTSVIATKKVSGPSRSSSWRTSIPIPRLATMRWTITSVA